jgi:endoglucanase
MPLANDLVTGKALDDRAGCVMMIEGMRRTKTKATVYAVGSIQEEVGSKGARTASFGLNPDVAIATETDVAGDYPGIEKKEAHLKLGKGPSVTVVDTDLITPEKVLQWIEETARKYDIPYQPDVGTAGSTDAAIINLTREGIPSGVVSVVTRYLHTPVEVLNLKDLDNAATLIARMLETVGEYF